MDGDIIVAAHGRAVAESDMDGAFHLFIFEQVAGNLKHGIGADAEFGDNETFAACGGQHFLQLFAAFALKTDRSTFLDVDDAVGIVFLPRHGSDRSIRHDPPLCSSVIRDHEHFAGGNVPDTGCGAEIGIVDLPVEVRETLKKRISTAVTKSITAQPKLKAIKTAAILPLVGDETAKNVETNATLFAGKAPAKDGGETVVLDGYVTHIVVDGVSRTSVTPKNADAQTRDELRRLLRDKPQVADGVLFGAVRALDVVYNGSAFRKTKYQVIADIQISIEEAASQNVLWSDTIQASVPYDVELSWWEWITLDYPEIDKASFYVGLAGRILLALVILLFLGKILCASSRVR